MSAFAAVIGAVKSHVKIKRQIRSEQNALSSLARENADVSRLRCLSRSDVSAIFADTQIAADWREAQRELNAVFSIPDLKSPGVNPGDRRAVYYLTRSFKPSSILEIGTCVGASTCNIAIAVRQNGDEGRITTVDIEDVNGPNSWWKRCGLESSPAENIARINMTERVRFISERSLNFMSTCVDTFDFIFLDGDHAAAMVYKEVPLALRILRPNGIILLHDFFPNNRPHWVDHSVVPGPFLAFKRLANEHAELKVLPLGSLPWPTKLGSDVTSLALLTCDSPIAVRQNVSPASPGGAASG